LSVSDNKDIVGLTSIEDIGVDITCARDALKKRGSVVHLSHTSPEELKYVKNARTGQEHLNYSLSTLTNAVDCDHDKLKDPTRKRKVGDSLLWANVVGVLGTSSAFDFL
jgi:hypothetical protein